MSASTKISAIHKSLLRVGTNRIDTKLTESRLCPINRAPKEQTFYDTIAFVIFCPKHKNIAVCNTYHSNGEIAVWLPFIYRSDKVQYSVAVEDGLCFILSDNDINLLFKYKEEKPFQSKIVDAIEMYFPNTKQTVIRINCLVKLHNNTPGFQCCRKTSRIHWLSVEEICNNIHDQFYGPEVYIYCMYTKSLEFYNQIFVVAPDLYQAKNYYQNYTVVTAEDYILNSLGITRKQIDLLFNDFFEHCFPGFVMTFYSFADYLSKYGFRETNNKMRRLFNSFKGLESVDPYCTCPYLSFNCLLLGMAYIDKDSPQDRCRLLFVFHYYDLNRDGILSEDEFREMVTDIHKNEGQEEIDKIVADGMTGNDSNKGMNFDEFLIRADSHQFGVATHLGKSEKHLLNNIYKAVNSRANRPMDTLTKLFKSISFRH